MQDIAAAMTNSLDRNGLGAMRSNLNMGGFRATQMAPGTSPTDGATVSQAGVPIGTVLDFAGSVAPDGFMFPFGQEISRATYADAFAVMGTTYGPGNGTTTFNLPNLRGVVVAGLDNMGGAAMGRLAGATALGAFLGSQTVTLNMSQMPAHSHGGITSAGGDHSHSWVPLGSPSGGQSGVAINFGTLGGTPINTSTAGNHSHVISSEGGNTGHPNVQPTFALNKIIKVSL